MFANPRSRAHLFPKLSDQVSLFFGIRLGGLCTAAQYCDFRSMSLSYGGQRLQIHIRSSTGSLRGG
jgi:hypothetical protein